jgi:pyruvate dehydrogenase E2 component (dihydrolipoamide acetyltransferase)
MANKILMPKLSPTMEEGQISRWLKKEGDEIEANETIAEVDTDKATMEMTSLEAGTLLKISFPAKAKRQTRSNHRHHRRKGRRFFRAFDGETARVPTARKKRKRKRRKNRKAPAQPAQSKLPRLLRTETNAKCFRNRRSQLRRPATGSAVEENETSATPKQPASSNEQTATAE